MASDVTSLRLDRYCCNTTLPPQHLVDGQSAFRDRWASTCSQAYGKTTGRYIPGDQYPDAHLGVPALPAGPGMGHKGQIPREPWYGIGACVHVSGNYGSLTGGSHSDPSF